MFGFAFLFGPHCTFVWTLIVVIRFMCFLKWLRGFWNWRDWFDLMDFSNNEFSCLYYQPSSSIVPVLRIQAMSAVYDPVYYSLVYILLGDWLVFLSVVTISDYFCLLIFSLFVWEGGWCSFITGDSLSNWLVPNGNGSCVGFLFISNLETLHSSFRIPSIGLISFCSFHSYLCSHYLMI